MHSNIKAASSNYTNLVDIGIGIVSGGLGGVVVSMLITTGFFLLWLTTKHVIEY
ncbi:hypothetical protein JHK86_010138 [Glycine max]|nr:hypothetical protein JHK86_010138 [Glycine max]